MGRNAADPQAQKLNTTTFSQHLRLLSMATFPSCLMGTNPLPKDSCFNWNCHHKQVTSHIRNRILDEEALFAFEVLTFKGGYDQCRQTNCHTYPKATSTPAWDEILLKPNSSAALSAIPEDSHPLGTQQLVPFSRITTYFIGAQSKAECGSKSTQNHYPPSRGCRANPLLLALRMKAASCSKVTLEIRKNWRIWAFSTTGLNHRCIMSQQIISNPEGSVCGEHRKIQVYNHKFNYLKW